ncbi:cobalt-precorrin 5A hydrolase [Rhodovulum sp. ES.010]|uniref:cobalamin biosynthesis protein n=1 Tax=Rhodovulum sp. ES.010 TaxID=1882821 RepID=UPI00092C5332|nr:cobalamin biosynthesis protein [Rhodovulum sp. ES.010]SIO32535.1 cobalt-precorrin 5A hydrolase [Rhodovulum sp. ES.010]
MRVAGFGFRKGADMGSLSDALAQAGGTDALTTLAAPEDKAGDPCLADLAARLGLPIHAISQAALATPATLTEAPRVRAARGTGSVAEATALVAAGPGARLTGPRQISTDRMAACAIATGETT